MAIFILVLVVFAMGIGFGLMIGTTRTMIRTATKIHGTKRPLIAKIVIGLGFAAFSGSIGTALYTWHFTRVAKSTSGTIVELHQRLDKESGHVSHAPVFRFQDDGGTEYVVQSSSYSSPPEFNIGDKARILYRDDDPYGARIDSYRQIWGFPTGLAIIGVIESVAGAVMLLWPKISGRFRDHTAHPANA